jgi:hypothetical protein
MDALTELKREANAELLQINTLGFMISFEGLTTLLTRSGDSDEAESRFRELREHLNSYLDFEERIEAITGDRATASKNRAERAGRIYIKRAGSYGVDVSNGTATGQTHFDLTPKDQSPAQVPTLATPQSH